MGAELPSKGHGTGITICSSYRNLWLMYSPARSRRLCCLFKHLEHVAGSDGSLIVPGLEHGTQQAGNVPRASSQHRGWARMTPSAPSPEMPSPAGRDGARLPRALQQTLGGAGAGPVLGEPSCLPPRRSTCALRGGSRLSEVSLAARAGCKPVAGGFFPASPEQLAARLQQSVAVRARGTFLPQTKGFLHGSRSSFAAPVDQGLQRLGRTQRAKV